MPKILFCSLRPFKKEWGAPKIMLEAAEELSNHGWECHFADPEAIGVSGDALHDSPGLRDFLKREAGKYDVVEYEHDQLPYDRSEFDPKTLMVARVSLLSLHFQKIDLPSFPTFKNSLYRLLGRFGFKKQRHFFEQIASKALLTLKNADLITVANDWDFQTIQDFGIDSNKIKVVPYGLTQDKINLFEVVKDTKKFPKRVAFSGTFDVRKGAPDLPEIFSAILEKVPEVQFRLMGTDGLYQGVESVLRFFPSSLRSRIEVIPHFESSQTPELLKDCSVGVFPSYVESFGFSVLEMMGSGIPVVAYRSPGPHSIVLSEDLVPAGNKAMMANKVCEYLLDDLKLKRRSDDVFIRSQNFSWKVAGNTTDQWYRSSLQ